MAVLAPGFNHPVRIDSVLNLGVAKARVGHADLIDADGSQVLTFNTIAVGTGESVVPANCFIRNAWVNVLTPFSGGGAAVVTVKLGDAANDDELLEAQSIFTGASGILVKDGAATLPFWEATAYAPLITIDADVDVADLTAGLLEVFIQYERIDTDSKTAA